MVVSTKNGVYGAGMSARLVVRKLLRTLTMEGPLNENATGGGPRNRAWHGDAGRLTVAGVSLAFSIFMPTLPPRLGGRRGRSTAEPPPTHGERTRCFGSFAPALTDLFS